MNMERRIQELKAKRPVGHWRSVGTKVGSNSRVTEKTLELGHDKTVMRSPGDMRVPPPRFSGRNPRATFPEELGAERAHTITDSLVSNRSRKMNTTVSERNQPKHGMDVTDYGHGSTANIGHTVKNPTIENIEQVSTKEGRGQLEMSDMLLKITNNDPSFENVNSMCRKLFQELGMKHTNYSCDNTVSGTRLTNTGDGQFQSEKSSKAFDYLKSWRQKMNMPTDSFMIEDENVSLKRLQNQVRLPQDHRPSIVQSQPSVEANRVTQPKVIDWEHVSLSCGKSEKEHLYSRKDAPTRPPLPGPSREFNPKAADMGTRGKLKPSSAKNQNTEAVERSIFRAYQQPANNNLKSEFQKGLPNVRQCEFSATHYERGQATNHFRHAPSCHENQYKRKESLHSERMPLNTQPTTSGMLSRSSIIPVLDSPDRCQESKVSVASSSESENGALIIDVGTAEVLRRMSHECMHKNKLSINHGHQSSQVEKRRSRSDSPQDKLRLHPREISRKIGKENSVHVSITSQSHRQSRQRMSPDLCAQSQAITSVLPKLHQPRATKCIDHHKKGRALSPKDKVIAYRNAAVTSPGQHFRQKSPIASRRSRSLTGTPKLLEPRTGLSRQISNSNRHLNTSRRQTKSPMRNTPSPLQQSGSLRRGIRLRSKSPVVRSRTSRLRSRSPRLRSRSSRRRSRSSRRRSRSPRRRSRSPRRRSRSPKPCLRLSRLHSISPRHHSRSPRLHSKYQRLRSRSPRLRSRSPRLRSISPRLRSISPRLRSRSPKLLSRSPILHSRSPRLRSRSPRLHSKYQRLRSKSPRMCLRSPRLRSRSPRLHLKSPRLRSRSPRIRSRSPRLRSRSPRLHTRSPRLRSRSPKLHSTSKRLHSRSPRSLRPQSISRNSSIVRKPYSQGAHPFSHSPRPVSRSLIQLARSSRLVSRSPVPAARYKKPLLVTPVSFTSTGTPKLFERSPTPVVNYPRDFSRSPDRYVSHSARIDMGSSFDQENNCKIENRSRSPYLEDISMSPKPKRGFSPVGSDKELPSIRCNRRSASPGPIKRESSPVSRRPINNKSSYQRSRGEQIPLNRKNHNNRRSASPGPIKRESSPVSRRPINNKSSYQRSRGEQIPLNRKNHNRVNSLSPLRHRKSSPVSHNSHSKIHRNKRRTSPVGDCNVSRISMERDRHNMDPKIKEEIAKQDDLRLHLLRLREQKVELQLRKLEEESIETEFQLYELQKKKRK